MRVQEEHDRIGWAQFTAPKAHHRFLSSAFHRDKHVLLLPIGRARDRLYVCVCVCVCVCLDCVFGLCAGQRPALIARILRTGLLLLLLLPALSPIHRSIVMGNCFGVNISLDPGDQRQSGAQVSSA